MDVVAMARPPPKRRKLSSYVRDFREKEHGTVAGDRPQAFAHALEPLQRAGLAQPAAGGIAGHQMLLPRQGTAMSTTSMSSAALTDSTSTRVSSAASMATTVSPELSVALSVSLSVGLPESAVSGLLGDVSGILAPSGTSIASSEKTSTSPSGGRTTSDTTPASSTGTASSSTNSSTEISTTSASANSGGNGTTSNSSTLSASDTTAATSTGDNTTTSSVLPSSTSVGFLTSSFSRNSTASENTTGSSSATTQSASSSETNPASSADSALLFIATLSQGDVTTLSRSANAYTTTFDGSTLTVPAASTTLTASSSDASRTSGSALSTSGSSSSNGQQTVASTATTEGGSGIAGQYSSSYAPTSTGPASNSNSSSNSTPPAGTIAGGVVGGAAGLAVVVLIAMLALRWYRRHGMTRHQALPQGPVNSPDPNAPSANGPGMAERAGLAPLVAAVPALFRNQNRNAEGSEPAQRGFTRVSGRKLPSAFSGGLSTEPPHNAPVNRQGDSDLNSTSFYRDSSGFYGGDGITGSPPSPTGSFTRQSNSHEHMTISPGPQRMPKLHAGGPYNMSPNGSAGPSSPQTASALNRSDAPFLLDPNRNSRFSEGL